MNITPFFNFSNFYSYVTQNIIPCVNVSIALLCTYVYTNAHTYTLIFAIYLYNTHYFNDIIHILTHTYSIHNYYIGLCNNNNYNCV